MTENIAKLKEWVDGSDNIVFFGGAGVSTESNIPDFRSVDGLYNQQYDYPPETILSHTFFMKKPEEFYRFYKNKMLLLDAKPNAAHLKLAELEAQGKLKAVVTQNIDGLHQAAGSKVVYELHGSVHVCVFPVKPTNCLLVDTLTSNLSAAFARELNRTSSIIRKPFAKPFSRVLALSLMMKKALRLSSDR